jgi:hypothetical protein
VWVTTQGEQLLRIDPRTAKRTDSLTLSNPAVEPVYMRGSLWLNYQGLIQEVGPIDLSTGSVLKVAGYPTSLAAGRNTLWALDDNGDLSRFVPSESDLPTTSLHVAQRATDVAVGSGAAWVAVSAAG